MLHWLANDDHFIDLFTSLEFTLRCQLTRHLIRSSIINNQTVGYRTIKQNVGLVVVVRVVVDDDEINHTQTDVYEQPGNVSLRAFNISHNLQCRHRHCRHK